MSIILSIIGLNGLPMRRKTGSVHWSTWLKIMAASDAKISDVSGFDSDPDLDTAIDLDAYGACSSSSTSKSSSVPSLLSTLQAP